MLEADLGSFKMKSLLYALVMLSLSATSFAFDGIYSIKGKSSLLGDYSGVAWVYKGQVQRKVQYQNYNYKNNSVESIWTGVEVENSFDFKLSLSNTLTTVEEFSPATEEFTPQLISFSKDVTNQAVNISMANEDLLETWILKSPATEAPLWKDLRSKSVGVGEDQKFVRRVFNFLGLTKILDLYSSSPEVLAYQDKKEFMEAKQYFISDKTDADFYATTPNVLRVTNKTVNPLSLTEAMMRKNAYGKTLAEKAQVLGNETINNNLNSAGFLEVALLDDQGNKNARRTEYDTALWSSMFGWAELMRYQNTKDVSALNNFKRVIDGEVKLLEITGNKKEFARGLAVSPLEEDLGEGWIQGVGVFADLKWRKGGNNDMIKGVFISLILAHQALDPQIDSELIKRIKVVAKDIAEQNVAAHGMNHDIAKGLNALWNKDVASLEEFIKSTHNLRTYLADATKVADGFYVGGIADWSGINLTMTTNICQILVAKELQSVFTNYPRLDVAQEKAEKRLLSMHKIYKNAHRDFLTIMTYAFSRSAKANADWKKMAREALWTLKEMPVPRSFGNGEADLRKHSHWSMSAWPRVPWKLLKGFRKLKDDANFVGRFAGAYSYPLFEAASFETTYLWKDMPFPVVAKSRSNIQNFSADYMVMYWAGRSSGLISADE